MKNYTCKACAKFELCDLETMKKHGYNLRGGTSDCFVSDNNNETENNTPEEPREILEFMQEEFNRPINNLYSAAIILCLALGMNENGCKNCPVTLFNYEKRTIFEKCCLHEPCQTNLYKWLIAKANEEKNHNKE